MRIIHVLRKPLSEGTVASNVLKHGCGGLNIDASRIGTGEDKGVWPQTDRQRNILRNPANKNSLGKAVVTDTTVGRWPANVILQHLDGCRCAGVKTAGSGRFVAHDAVVRTSTMMDPDKGWNGNSLDNSKETVANWICESGCPVARLDGQSGVLTSGKPTGTRQGTATRSAATYSTNNSVNNYVVTGFGDTGGASRFYKQIGGSDE